MHSKFILQEPLDVTPTQTRGEDHGASRERAEQAVGAGMRHGPPCSSAWWKRATLVMAQGEKAEAELQTEVLKVLLPAFVRTLLGYVAS